MKVSFLDFWDGFEETNNFIYYLFREIHDNLTIVSPDKANLIIFSVFGNSNYLYNHCPKLFYTGENKRPDFNKCNYSISFDFDDYGGKNIRIPLWYYYIDWFDVGSYGNPSYLIPKNYLYEPNEFSKREKLSFCSAVYSNPVSVRNYVVSNINQYKKVDCFGKLPNFSFLPDGEKQKLNVISNYKFNICFENSSFPGYYTEKLLHAKISGCIPIYLADENISKDFNDKSFININHYKNTDEFLSLIIEMDMDHRKFKELQSQPIFNKEIDLNTIYEKLSNIK